jgi:hypothetical protein
LLMIAGHLDLSVGTVIPASSMAIAMSGLYSSRSSSESSRRSASTCRRLRQRIPRDRTDLPCCRDPGRAVRGRGPDWASPSSWRAAPASARGRSVAKQLFRVRNRQIQVTVFRWMAVVILRLHTAFCAQQLDLRVGGDRSVRCAGIRPTA